MKWGIVHLLLIMRFKAGNILWIVGGYNSASTIVLFPFTVQMLFHRGTYITIFLDHCYVQLKYLGFSDVRMQPISKTDFRTGNQKGSSGNTVSSYYCSTRWLCKFLLFMFFCFQRHAQTIFAVGNTKKDVSSFHL